MYNVYMEYMYDPENIELTIDIANEVLMHLQNAKEKLGSARNWGIVDIMGGGIFTSIFKHNRIKDAQMDLERAKRAMDELMNRLYYYNNIGTVNINIDEFMGAFDILFDNPIVDIFMQAKISNVRKQIDDAIDEIEDIIGYLYSGASEDVEI